MSTPPDDESARDFSAADEQWYNRLTGRAEIPGDTSDSDAIAEADALRRALELERQEENNNPRLQKLMDPVAQETKLRELKQRLRHEGLLGEDLPGKGLMEPVTHPRRKPWGFAAGLALAAALAIFMLAPLLKQNDAETGRVYYDAPPVMRGALPVVRKVDEHPRQAIETLAAYLKAAGMDVVLYQSGAVFMADIDVPVERLDELRARLEEAGIPVRGGLVRVEIGPR